MPSTRCPTMGSSTAAGVPTSAASSSSFGRSVSSAMAPTATILTIDLPLSNSAWVPKICFAPWSGLSFFGSGLSASGEGLKPTWPTLISTPATRHTAAIGASEYSQAEPTMPKICGTVSAPTVSGWLMSPSRSRVACDIRRIIPGANAERASSAASRTTAPLRSIDRATWPFLRASSRFLGVAFSVLFSAITPPSASAGRWRRSAGARPRASPRRTGARRRSGGTRPRSSPGSRRRTR